MTTRPFGRSSLILALVLIGTSLLAVACGSSSSSTPATSAAATSEPTTEATSASSGTDATPQSAATPEAATPEATTEPQEITVTDIVGRSVTVNAPVQQVILGEGRQLYIVAMLDPENPFQRVAAWRDDLMKNDPTPTTNTWRSSRRPPMCRSSATRPAVSSASRKRSASTPTSSC
jgi:ABC-type Fe3+-hydroxamate transport system substrate-binding protein